MARLHSISVRLVLAVAGVGIAASVLLGAFSVTQQEAFGDVALQQTLKLQFENVIAAFEYEARTARTAAAVVATLPGIAAATAREDRAALQAIMAPAFEALQRQGVPLLNVQKPPAVNVFRVHDPKSFGDDVSARRKTVLKATGEHVMVDGIEADRTGISVFGVVPLDHDGRLVGVADVAIPMRESFLQRIKERFGIDLALHRIEDGKVTTLSATFAEKTTATPEEVRQALAGATIEGRRTLGARPVALLLGQLKNFAGEPIAVIELVKDNTAFATMGAQARQRLMIATLAILVAAVVLGLLVGRGMSRPIRALTGTMNALSGGDTAVAVPGLARRDELGLMAKAVQVFKDNAVAMQQLREQQVAAEARAVEEKRAALVGMADRFEASVAGVVDAVSTAATEMQATARSMTAAADQAMQRTGAANTASAVTSGNVQTVASATEELSASIGEIGQQVSQASQITAQAMTQALATNATVQSLSATAERIGAVVAMINGIASQTNLLALNATIEAARAGDAGKGFAVVASEVKTLAGQTAKATDEISGQVSAIQSETKQAVSAIEAICGTITGVDSISSSIAAAVEQQSAATHEIARNVQQAALGTAEVADHLTGVSGAVGDTDAAARLVLDAAGELAAQSRILRTEVDRFLGQVRAA